MTINVENLSEFFNTAYDDDTIIDTTNYQSNYQTGALDILMQRARRSKAVRENKIFDYIQAENDPYFSRESANVRDKFERYISALSLSTSVITVINAKLQMAGIDKFIPVNLRNLLLNFQTIADTNINMLNNIQQLVSFRQIEQALFSDLRFQFLGNTITFTDIALLADRILEVSPTLDSIKNNGLRPLLSLGLQNFLPSSMLSVFDTIQYLDTLNNIFNDSDTFGSLFTDKVKSDIRLYSKTTIDTVVNKDKYNDIDITLDDPLGLNAKSNFKQEVTIAYHNKIREVVTKYADEYSLSSEQIDQVVLLLQDDASQNISDALDNKSVGLPNISRVTKAVTINSHNETVNAINNALDRVTSSIISDLKTVKQPSSDIRALDYLINLKTNIRKRIAMQNSNASSEEFTAINNYLKNFIKSDNISIEIVNDLNDRLDVLLKEKIKLNE